MTINNITFEITSANSNRIYLPCQITEDLSWEATKALCESGKDIQDIASITAYIVPHVSPIKPIIGYRLEVITTDGQYITKHLKANFTAEKASDILNRFFKAGAPGLAPEVRKLYQSQHNRYPSKRPYKQAA